MMKGIPTEWFAKELSENDCIRLPKVEYQVDQTTDRIFLIVGT